MAIRRFFVNEEQISGNKIVITDDEHNHLKNVLRLNVGDKIIVVCNNEFDYYATIENISKNNTICNITKEGLNIYNPKTNVTVYQALTKKDAMSNLVQRLSELGVSNFVPLVTTYTTAKDSIGKSDKLQTVANQSTKQCKRSIALKVENTMSFKELIKKVSSHDLVVFANELENSKKLSQLFNGNDYNNVGIVIGSEGGFTEIEANELVKAGAQSVTLGKRILRAETACLAVTSIVVIT